MATRKKQAARKPESREPISVEPHPFKAKYPRLYELVSMGEVFVDEGQYVGHAEPEGCEVALGNVGEEAKVEAYLARRPTARDW